MSAPANNAAATATPPAKKGMKVLVLLIVVSLLSIGAGAAAPMFFLKAESADHHKEKKPAPPSPDEYVPFGEVSVTLSDGRGNRYLRVKLVLVVGENDEKHPKEKLEAKKAALRNWLITHLSDKSLPEVMGRASLNRIRREIHEHFSAALFPEGGEHIRDVFFEEFVIQ